MSCENYEDYVVNATRRESYGVCARVFEKDVSLSLTGNLLHQKYTHLRFIITQKEATRVKFGIFDAFNQLEEETIKRGGDVRELYLTGFLNKMVDLHNIPVQEQHKEMDQFKTVVIFKLVLVEQYGTDIDDYLLELALRQRREAQEKEEQEQEKKRLKRLRQKQEKQDKTRWFVRIKSFQAGSLSNEGKQVVKHWKD